MKSKEEPELPSLFKMIRNFSKEMVKYIKEGTPNVTMKDYANRLDICQKCPSYIKSSARCGECGCLLEHKAKWQTAECPLEKWPKVKESTAKELNDRKREG